MGAILRDPLSGEVLRGSLASMLTRTAGLIIAFLSHVLISRILGVSAYGEYSIALGLALVLVVPARLGLDHAALRFASIYFEQGNFCALKGLIRFTLLVVVGSSMIIMIGLITQSRLGLSLLSTLPSKTPLWIGALISSLAALGIYSALIRSTKRVLAAQIYEQVLRPAVLIAGIGLLVVSGFRLSALGAIILTVLASLVALAGIAIHMYKILPPLKSVISDTSQRRQWIAVGLPLVAMNMIQELLNQIDVLFLGHLVGASASGLYAAAWRLASLVPFALVALSFTSAPLIAVAYGRGDFAELARIAKMNSRLAFAFSLGMVAFLAIVGRVALLAFGPGFEAAFPALIILLLGGLISAATGAVGHLMTMTGGQNRALLSVGLALVFNVILNLNLIPRLGITGAAIAATSSILIYNILMWIHVRRTMGIDASVIAMRARVPSQAAAPYGR